MNSKVSYKTTSLALLPFLGGMLVPVASVSAQVIPSADGLNTTVDVVGDRIDINGGQLSNDNANLFQSFEQFDINAQKTANFVTPANVQNVVGRIHDTNASTINGTLQVTGSDANLYLMNPSGILMGPDAQLNLSGGFTATTATGIGFEDGQFETAIDGHYSNLTGNPTEFQFGTQQAGAVVNMGELSVEEGQSLNLIGGTVVNTGELSAPGGSITVAAVEGESVVRISQSDQLLSLEVEARPFDGGNGIAPEGIGEMLTGGGLSNATALITNADGSVRLGNITEQNDRQVTETGGSTTVTGRVSVNGETGGNINVLGSQISLINASLDASGDRNGGLIRVGGDYRGNGSVFDARETAIDSDSTLLVNANNRGNGGTAIVWSDNVTEFFGSIEARGGALEGNGGFTEVSGKSRLVFDGTVDVSAASGIAGSVLLDPNNLVITDGPAPADDTNNSYISSSTIEGFGAGLHILEATDHITIQDLLDNELTIDKDITLEFRADTDGDGIGAITMEDRTITAANPIIDTIRADRSDVIFSGAGVYLGNINTSTNHHNAGGGPSTEPAGSVTIRSTLDATVNRIYAYATQPGHHSEDAGSINIIANDGDIDIVDSIKAFASVSRENSNPANGDDGRESGSGGSIELRADNGDIRVSATNPTTDSVLQTSSEAEGHTSGDGGLIALTALNGDIDVAGQIASWSKAGGRNSYGDGNAGNAGDVILQAGNISAGAVLANSSTGTATTSGNNAGSGGTVIITATGSADIGNITTASTTGKDSALGGGDVLISARTSLSTGNIDTQTEASDSAGMGGDVILSSNSATIGNINAASVANGDTALGGGAVTITTATTIDVNGIDTSTRADSDTAGGGNITLTGLERVTVGEIDAMGKFTGVEVASYAYARDSSGTGNAGNAGSVDIVSDNIQTGLIESWSRSQGNNSGEGGTVTLSEATAGSNSSRIEIQGGIEAYSRVGGSAADSGGAVTATADSIEISKQAVSQVAIDTSSVANGGAGDGGNIILNSRSILTVTGNIRSDSDGTFGANSGDGGAVDLFGSVIDVEGSISSSANASSGAGSAGDVTVVAEESLEAEGIYASSTNGPGADVRLVGDRINAVGTTGSVSSENLFIETSNSAQTISIGGTTRTASDLDILDSDLIAFSNVSNLMIGRPGDDTSTIRLQPGLTSRVSSRPLIKIEGGSTLVGADETDNIFSITGGDSGELLGAGLSFSGIENLVGGNQKNEFRIEDSGSVSGQITGNGTLDIIDYSVGFTSPISVNLGDMTATNVGSFIGIEEIEGTATSADTLIGSNVDETFEITGNSSGIVNTLLTFRSIEQIDGAGGNNTLDYSSYSTPVEIDLQSATATGLSKFTNFQTLVGGSGQEDTITGTDGNNTFQIGSEGINSVDGINFLEIEAIDGGLGNNVLRGNDQENTWVVGGASGNTLNEKTSFSRFGGLVGGMGDDTFEFEGSGVPVETIVGGDGSDRISYERYQLATDTNLATNTTTGISGTFSGIEGVTGSASSQDIVRGTDSNDEFVLGANGDDSIEGVIDFSGIERIDGQSGENRLRVDSTDDLVWTVNGINQGALNGREFENISELIGGMGDNSFQIKHGGRLTGGVTGSTNPNSTSELDYRNFGSAVTVDLAAMTVNGQYAFSEVKTIIGDVRYRNTLRGTADDNLFEITGERRGLVNSSLSFFNIDMLDGVGGNNTFNITNLDRASDIVVNGGNSLANSQDQSRIIANSENAYWQIDGPDTGAFLEGDQTFLSFVDVQHLENVSTTGGEDTVSFSYPNSQITGSIASGHNDLLLIGDDINIGQGSDGDNRNGRVSGSGRLTIRPRSNNVAVELGGRDAGAVSTLNITEGELAALQSSFELVKIEDSSTENGTTGGIRSNGDVAFVNAVELRSRAGIDTTAGELSSTDSILLETNQSIDVGDIRAQGSVSLQAQEDITTGDIGTQGEGSISLSSAAGGIAVAGALNSSDSDIAEEISVVASASVTVAGEINSGGSDRSGNVTITSNDGSIKTGGITTSTGSEPTDEAGSVTVESPGSIEIEFIEATGHTSNTARPVVSIDSRDSVAIAGGINAVDKGFATITTDDSASGIYIIYGEDGEPALNFSLTQQGLTTDSVSVVAGVSSQNLNVRNINIINRGIQPEAPDPALEFSLTALQFRALDESIDLTPEEQDNLFTQLETSIGSEFNQYLGLSNNGEEKQIATLYQAQNTLRNVENVTGVTPALVYVYFLPDASTEASVTPNTERIASPSDQLEVMLIMGDDEPIRHRQWGITREQVEAIGQELRDQTTRQFSRPKQYLPPAQQLYDWLIRPLEEALTQHQVESIGFVLDTGLRTVPLATLHDGEQYLIEDYSIGVLPTFSLTDFALNGVDRAAFDTSEVLAMGASRFENQPDLPAVDAELQMIADENWEGDTFLNETFVVENLQTQLQEKDYGVVHLATHATFESGDLESSYIQFWDEQLSLSNIDALKLDEADVNLIILSACNTAMGDAASEYGFAGFAVSTGAPSAVASLWPVSDEGTLGFMSQFYGQLRGSEVRTEALRQAQIRLLNGEVRIDDGIVYGPNDSMVADIETLRESGRWDFSHPFYWSAFTMIGNPW